MGLSVRGSFGDKHPQTYTTSLTHTFNSGSDPDVPPIDLTPLLGER